MQILQPYVALIKSTGGETHEEQSVFALEQSGINQPAPGGMRESSRNADRGCRAYLKAYRAGELEPVAL